MWTATKKIDKSTKAKGIKTQSLKVIHILFVTNSEFETASYYSKSKPSWKDN